LDAGSSGLLVVCPRPTELRQIDLCKQPRNYAAWIEHELGIEAGEFGGRREP